jgi:2,3-bisphosphoglycerate-dependent phosphoglycerate mutase
VRLLLIRHGESICSVDGVVGGAKGCTGLTPRGLEQAAALRDQMVRTGDVPDVVLASTLPRAIQTAEVVAEAFGVPVEQRDDLCELVPGECDGGTWDDWRETYGSFDVTTEPDRPVSPGGESWNGFRARVLGVVEAIAGAHDGRTIAAFCHGGVIFTSVVELFGLRAGDHPSLDADFTSVTEWRRAAGRWRLARFNDVSHIRGTALLPTS